MKILRYDILLFNIYLYKALQGERKFVLCNAYFLKLLQGDDSKV